MKTEKIFAEVGFGNPRFFSTEIENNSNEKRVKGFIRPKEFRDFYLRICVFKLTLILSTYDIIKIKINKKNKFRFVFGIGGYN